MIQKILVSIAGLVLGIILGFVVFFYLSQNKAIISGLGPTREVIGFLPYWQVGNAKKDYSSYITTLTYFGLALDNNGTILKLVNSTQLEPGWSAFSSGKVKPYLDSAKQKNINLSLLIFSGNVDTINSVLNDPTTHAKNLVEEIEPIMQKSGFNDLNLDIEYTSQASPEASIHFTQFVNTVKKLLKPTQTLSLELMSTDAIKKNLIDISSVGKIADRLIIMAYDYHSPDSYVTGPIAPENGAGIDSEYDVTTSVEKTIKLAPSSKVILGVPLYGYEWESLSPNSRSATIAGSGVIASNHRAETLLATCSTCSATLDNEAQELHISYLNTDTNTYHQFFIPTEDSTKAKIYQAENENLAGVALWALGYEGNTILKPLVNYKN